MNASIYNISLDLHMIVAPKVLPIKQGDTARELRVTLAEDGSPYEFGAMTAYLCAELPGGTTETARMSADGNVLVVRIPDEWCDTVGAVQCEVQLFELGGDGVLISPRFCLIVNDALDVLPLPEIYFGEYVNASSVDTANGAYAYPGAEPCYLKFGDGTNKSWWVAIPAAYGITPIFKHDGTAQINVSQMAGESADRHGTTRAYTVYVTSAAAVRWTVTIPAVN